MSEKRKWPNPIDVLEADLAIAYRLDTQVSMSAKKLIATTDFEEFMTELRVLVDYCYLIGHADGVLLFSDYDEGGESLEKET